MPTLNIAGEDNHFVIKVRPHGSQPLSYQVTEGGIKFLERNGIPIPKVAGDKATFGKSLFDKMNKKGLVYTKGEHSSSVANDEDLNAEQRLGLVFREKKNRNGWELAVAARKIPDVWRKQAMKVSGQTCKLHICDPNTFYHREQRLLGSWTLTDILTSKPCAVEPITGRYIVEVRGTWPSACNIQKWIYDFNGMSVDGTFFHDTAHGGWRVASHEVIYPGQTYYLVAPVRIVIPMGVESRLLTTLPAVSPYSSLEKWQAWSIRIPHTIDELTYGRLQNWFESIGYSLREFPWRLALLSPPAIYYTSEGIPVLPQGSDAVIEVLPPTDRIQGVESTQIQVKIDTISYLPPTTEIRSHCFLTFPLPQPGSYFINGVNGLARPLNFKAAARQQDNSFESPQALHVTVKITENVYHFDTFEHDPSTPHEHILALDDFDKMSLPQISIVCPIPLDLSWTFGKESELHWHSSEPKAITECIEDIFRQTWKKHETVTLCLDAGAFGKITIKVALNSVNKQHPVIRDQIENLESTTERIQQRLQWLLKELERQNGQGVQTSIPLTIRQRLGRLKSVPECTTLLQYSLVPLSLFPHLVAMTTILEREQNILFSL